jgi:hypothetical protein
MMKMILLVCLLFILVGTSLAQQSREEKLQQLKDRDDIKVTEVEPNLLKIEYINGEVLYKNISDYRSPVTDNLIFSPTYDSTIIDLTTIDTTLYYYKYSFWKEVPIANWSFDHIRIGDVNGNGLPELYGSRKYFWNDFEPITIYELNPYGHFDFRYQYDSVFNVISIYDVDRDENEEVLLKRPIINDTLGNEQRYFSKPTSTSFATQLNFIYKYGTGAQLNDQTLGDFDGDENSDLIFARFSTPSVYIFEYNPLINNFDSVYRFDVNEPAPWGNSGFSVDDFDLDGKADIVFGTGRGNIFVLENEGNNQYTNSWSGSVESNHAYIHTHSNDIDKNSKPEFWVLADAYYNGIGTTRITIFETNGDNSYQIVGRVDLVGVFSFYAGTMQAVDIDHDGIQEIAVCIDDNFLILKFNGSRDHHRYELYYIKKNELTSSGENSFYYGAFIYDLKSDSNMNLLISMDHVILQGATGRFLTRIYIPDSLSASNDVVIKIPESPNIKQNYPNPFNPVTSITIEISELSNVILKVYDILGKEIKTLLEKELSPSSYTLSWEARDSNGKLLPSGVYLIQLNAGNYTKVIKALLMR